MDDKPTAGLGHGPNDLVRVFSSLDFYEMQHVKAALEGAGIQAVLLPDPGLMIATGEVPYVEAMPEVYVSPAGEGEARDIIAALAQGGGDPWQCASCGEEVDGELGRCWNCGGPSPAC